MTALPTVFVVQVALAPLPEPFMRALREIEVETSVGQASIFRLHFDLSRTRLGDFDALAIDIFRPNVPIRISVTNRFGVPQTIVNGYVGDAQLGARNDPGGSTLEVVGMDALGTSMTLVEQPFTWPNTPDSGIAAAIFGKYGIAPFIPVPTPALRTALDTTTTQCATDAEYLAELAEYHGYEHYVQPDPILGIDVGHFHPPQVPPLAPSQGVLSIDFGTQTNLSSFSVSNDMLAPTSVAVMSSDRRTRVAVPLVVPVAAEPPMGLEPTLNRIVPLPVERASAREAAGPGEALFRAKARATESSRVLRASGEVDGLKFPRPLRVGLPVLVRGAGRQYSGPYYVTSVDFRISRDAYTQRFSAWRNAVGLTGAEVFIDPLAAVP